MQEKMSKFKFKLASWLIIFCTIILCNCSHGQQAIDHKENIVKYKTMLQIETNNCFYAAQIAGSYQALNDFGNAIEYYQKALANCPDSLFDKFQLGVCYYLTMNKDKGLSYMDKAIEGAKNKGDNEMVKMFTAEKEAWLARWDSVRELEWNKGQM